MEKPENHLLVTVASISEGVITTNDSGEITYMNPTAEKLTGWKKDEALNQPLEKIYTVTNEETGKRFENIVNRILREGKTIEFENNTILETKDARKLIISNNGAPIRNNDGSIIGAVLVFRDITEKKNAQSKLQKSESHVRAIFEYSSLGFMLIDEDYKILEFNTLISDFAKNSFGGQLVKGENLIEILPEERRKPFKERISKVLKGESIHYESEYPQANEEKICFFVNLNPVFDAQNKITGICFTVENITEKKKAEKKFIQSEQQNRSLIENITDAIILINEKSEVIFQSPSTERITGFVLEDLKGKTVFDFIHPDDLQSSLEFFQQVIAEPGVLKHKEYRIIHKKGHYIWIEGSIINLLHDENVKGFIVNYRDITERKNSEEELKKLSQAVEQSPASVVITDTNGNIEYVNQKFLTLTGYKIEEVKGKNSNILKSGYTSASEYNKLWSSITSGHEWKGELHNKKKNGDFYWESALISPILNSQGKIINFLAVKEDITEKKKAEEELLIRSENLKEAQRIAHLGSWSIDLQKKITWSDETYRIHGVSRESFTPNPESLMTLIHPSDKADMQAWIKKFALGEKVGELVLRTVLPDGSIRYLNTMGEMKYDMNNKPVYISGTVQDITETVLLEKEKNEIQERVMARLEENVIARTKELNFANKILEQRNHEITDSIVYAKNIQRAILSKHEDFKKQFNNTIVLWLPKAIVSGDFYWCYSNKEYDFIAVADCTGHGVPGALMSIISNQILHRVVTQYGLTEPKEILFHLDDAIMTALRQENGMVKDGMDMALCRIDKKNNKVVFAGAQRPLFFYNGETLQEIAGTKMGIGGNLGEIKLKNFNQTEINYKQGDRMYLTSDGYYSQFGGAGGKKMMKKRMTELLSQIACEDLDEQKNLLIEYYNKWQGLEEQVDDVMVVGVEL